MFDWFWNSALMVTLQGWVDATRALPIDPIWWFIGLMGIALGLVAWFNQPPSTRDQKLPGTSYKGKVTPKTIEKMLVTPKRRQLRSRKQMEAEVRRAREMRRSKASRGTK